MKNNIKRVLAIVLVFVSAYAQAYHSHFMDDPTKQQNPFANESQQSGLMPSKYNKRPGRDNYEQQPYETYPKYQTYS